MLGHLRPWGSRGLLGHVSISAPNCSKLNSQTVECLFIRYPEYLKGYVMTNEGYVGAMEVESRDVTFIEDKVSNQKKARMYVDLYELPDESSSNGSQIEAVKNPQEIHENSGSEPLTNSELRRSSLGRVFKLEKLLLCSH